MPSQTFQLKSALSATYGLMVLLTIATTVEIFIPYFLQEIRAYSPIKAGCVTVGIALGWSFSSIVFSGCSPTKIKILLKVGPILLFIGLIGLGFYLPVVGPLPQITLAKIAVSLLLIGSGVGMGWPHLLTRVLQLAPKEEVDRASTSITGVQLL